MLAAEPYMLVFRILHIVGGVLWVGSTFFLSVFLGPTVTEVGPSAGPLMNKLVVERRVTKVITTIAIVTVVAGGFVYWHNVDVYGSLGNFVGSTFGLVLTIGAVLGITAMFWGITRVGNTIEQMVHYAAGAMPVEGPPPPEVVGELDRRGAALKRDSIIDLALQIGAVLAMSTARYW